MVEGFQAKKAVVTDLDGTLINGNSMKIFMKMLPGMLVRKGYASGAVKSLACMAMRALRLVSHRRMKWELTRISLKLLDAQDWNSVAEKICLDVNPEVARHLDAARKEGAAICLSTAAMAEYCVHLSPMLGIELMTATEFNPVYSEYKESKGIRKLEDIRKMLYLNGLELSEFLTDHHDDLPVAKAFPGKTLLVNPSEITVRIFRENAPLQTIRIFAKNAPLNTAPGIFSGNSGGGRGR